MYTPLPQSPRAVLGKLGWGWEPECAADAVSGRGPCPSFHGTPCRSSQGQQVPARRALSPSQRSLLRSGGNISCQDLSSPGCSLESATAAADTQVSFTPTSPWHPGGFFLQPDVPVPKIPLREMLQASGCSGNRQSWQVPPGGVRNTPAGLLTAQSMGRACVRQIFPQTSPALQRAHWKKKKGSDSNKTVGRLPLLFF